MQGIKNLLFDFGNVLFDIDLARIDHHTPGSDIVERMRHFTEL